MEEEEKKMLQINPVIQTLNPHFFQVMRKELQSLG